MVLVFILNSSVPVETYFFNSTASEIFSLPSGAWTWTPLLNQNHHQAEIHLQLLKTFAFTFHWLARKLKGDNESRFVNLISLKKGTDENL